MSHRRDVAYAITSSVLWSKAPAFVGFGRIMASLTSVGVFASRTCAIAAGMSNPPDRIATRLPLWLNPAERQGRELSSCP
jgi:hypothetical protein